VCRAETEKKSYVVGAVGFGVDAVLEQVSSEKLRVIRFLETSQ